MDQLNSQKAEKNMGKKINEIQSHTHIREKGSFFFLKIKYKRGDGKSIHIA